MQNTQWAHLREENGGRGVRGETLEEKSSHPRTKSITNSMKQVVQRDGQKT
jgi:hypothetical protein